MTETRSSDPGRYAENAQYPKRSAAEAPFESSPTGSIVIFVLAAVITALAIVGVYHVEQAFLTERRTAHVETARARIDAVREELADMVDTVIGLRSYFNSSVEVTPEEFQRFTAESRSEHPYLQALAWAPRVLPRQMNNFMARARGIHPGFELVSPSRTAPASLEDAQRTHYPILYRSTAQADSSVPVGLDIGLDPSVRDALTRARVERRAILMGPVDLRPDQALADRMIVVAPLNDAGASSDGGTQANGAVIAVFRLDELMRQALKEFGDPPVTVSIHRSGADGSRGLLQRVGSEPSRPAGEMAASPVRVDDRLTVGGARWSIVAVPQPDPIAAGYHMATWIAAGLGGVFLTALILGYQRLRRRFREIQSSNTSLYLEMDQRLAAETEAERAEKALEILSACNRTLTAADDEGKLYQDIVDIARRRGGYSPAVLLLWRANEGAWQWVSSEDDKSLIERRQSIEAMAEDAMELRRTVTPTSMASAASDPSRPDGGLLTVPIQHRYQTPYGVLILGCSQALTSRETRVLEELGKDLSYGISTLRLREREHQNAEHVSFLAYYDAKTQLPNRAFLVEALEQLPTSPGYSTAVVTFDLINQSAIRDSLGPSAAADVTVKAAELLSGVLEPILGPALTETAQLALVLRLPNTDDVYHVAEQGIAALDGPVETTGATVLLRSRAGVASDDQIQQNASELVRASANALLRTSASRPIKGYASQDDEAHVRDIHLAPQLRRAIETDRLLLHFQPKIDTSTHRLVGLEGLVRWPTDDGGMVSPGDFIPLAEKTGLITWLTDWVLDTGIAYLALWHQQGRAVPLAVNVSMLDLARGDIVQLVQERLERANVPPDLLELEVTEEAFMEEAAGVADNLRQLRSLGITVSIDDFGTGYSSLAYLQHLPVTGLKIDRAFLSGLPAEGTNATVVSSALGIAKGFGLKTVAEGIEDITLLETLARMGCPTAQGFGIARPMPASELDTWLNEHSTELGPGPLEEARNR